MAIGPFSAAVIVEAMSEGGKKVLSDLVGKATGAAGKAVEQKVMESLGGKGVIDDEIAYEQLEADNLTAEELLILKEFRDMKRLSFGNDPKAVETYKDWDNDFRQAVLKRRISGKSKPSPKTVKKKDGTVTTTEDERSTPPSNKPAIDFLKRFTAHIKVERDKWKRAGTKRAAGFAAGQAYLDNYNLPSDRPSALGQQVKGIATSVPGAVNAAKDKVAAAIHVIKSAGAVAATTIGEVAEISHNAFIEHTDNHAERQKARRGIVGWLSRILN